VKKETEREDATGEQRQRLEFAAASQGMPSMANKQSKGRKRQARISLQVSEEIWS
jgi:hypothetical protein